MTSGPGGPPPPIPPEPRWGVPPPPSPGPTPPPPRNALVGGIAVALAVSLAVNAILALRVKDESDQQTRLRTKVTELQAEVDALRSRAPEAGGTILQRISAAVEQIRELRFKREVPAEILTDEKLRERVSTQFRADNPRAEIDDIDKVLTVLGLLGSRDDLFDILLGVQTEQVAGYYDSKTKRLVVGGDARNPTPLDRVLLAHEYVHAVTDQHFDLGLLDRLQDQAKDDEALAYLSLVEGDAMVAMGTYATRFLTPSEQREFFGQSTQVQTERLDSAPKVIQRSLLFPYEEGIRFVQAILSNGGIAALDRAYKDPPTSTEQILHSDRFIGRRDAPTEVATPDLAKTMGAGWRNMKGGGIGEFDLRLIVNEFLTRSDAESAGEGWDGGRFAAAELKAGGVVVAALTVWDSESEAREATEILGRWLPDRYGNRGQDMRLGGSAARGWASDAGAGAVFRVGSRVLLVLAPERGLVERARSAFDGF